MRTLGLGKIWTRRETFPFAVIAMAALLASAAAHAQTFRPLQTLRDGEGPATGLTNAAAVALSPDGTSAYVASTGAHALASSQNNSGTSGVESSRTSDASRSPLAAADMVDGAKPAARPTSRIPGG